MMAGLEQMSQYGSDIDFIHVPCVPVAGYDIQVPGIKDVDAFTTEPDAAFQCIQFRLRNRRIQQDAFVLVQRLLLFFRQFREIRQSRHGRPVNRQLAQPQRRIVLMTAVKRHRLLDPGQ